MHMCENGTQSKCVHVGNLAFNCISFNQCALLSPLSWIVKGLKTALRRQGALCLPLSFHSYDHYLTVSWIEQAKRFLKQLHKPLW